MPTIPELAPKQGGSQTVHGPEWIQWCECLAHREACRVVAASSVEGEGAAPGAAAGRRCVREPSP